MSDLDAKLAAYVDGELDPAETPGIEALIASNPAAEAKVRELRSVGALLRAACSETRYTAPLPWRDRRQERGRTAARAGVAAAAAVLIAVLSFEVGWRLGSRPPAARDVLVEEVASYHRLYARETEHLVELPAAQPEKLVAWLHDRLGRPVAIPDLTSRGYTFAGGRLLVINNQPVAQLLFTRPGEIALGVCLTPADREDPAVRVDHLDRLAVVSWADAHMTWVVVGEVPEPAARDLADQIMRQMHG
jgi:anti-sigma factor RsiW